MVTLRGQRRTLVELEDEVFFDIGDSATKRWRFASLLALAAVIATAGVLSDSTATVIGAMIVAPLGTPIIGTALGIVIGNPVRVASSTATVLLGATGVIVIGWLLAAILPDLVPLAQNSQISGRTSPNLIDLVAAVATGFVGAYGLARKDISDVLPGVAIAISLVPPLAVVGITAQAGDMDGAFGAFVLFASNMMAMIVAGSIFFTAYGYATEAQETPGFRRRLAYTVVAAATILILVPMTITTVETVDDQLVLNDAHQAAVEWSTSSSAEVVGASFDGNDLVLVLEGGDDLSTDGLLAALQGAVPAGTRVVVNRVDGERFVLGMVA
jgi:uncharacterized hydrophobic protein (TIGR00271 family)